MRLGRNLLLVTTFALAASSLALGAEAAPGAFDRAAAAKLLERNYDACLADDRPISFVVTFRSSGDVVSVAGAPGVESCVAKALAGARVPTFSGPDVRVRKTVRRSLGAAATVNPSALVSIQSIDLSGMGRGHVEVVVQNGAPDEREYAVEGVRYGEHKTWATGIAPGTAAARAAIKMRWPTECSASPTTEMRVQLHGRDADPTPKLVRLTTSGCKVRIATVDDPVTKGNMSEADLARRNAGRLYYRKPELVARPTACGDRLVVRAELVNATTDVVHHAALRLLQAEPVAEVGVTLNPGEARVVERAAGYEGFGVPIDVEGMLDAASTSALPTGSRMRDHQAGVAIVVDCNTSAALLPVP